MIVSLLVVVVAASDVAVVVQCLLSVIVSLLMHLV